MIIRCSMPVKMFARSGILGRLRHHTFNDERMVIAYVFNAEYVNRQGYRQFPLIFLTTRSLKFTLVVLV